MYRTRRNPYSGKQWQDELDFDLLMERNSRGDKIFLSSEAVHILWFYNKTIFDKLGLRPPATDVEFIAVSDKLRTEGYTPFAVPTGYVLNQWFMEIYADQFARNFTEYVRAQPGDWDYDEALDGKFKYDPQNRKLGTDFTHSFQRSMRNIRDGKIRFDGPEYLAFATMFQKMFNARNNFAEWAVGGQQYEAFLTGRVGMFPAGSGEFIRLGNDMAAMGSGAFEFATFENPSATGPEVKGPVRSVESAAGVYLSIVNKNPQQTAMALDFAQFWLSQEGYQAWVDGQLASPRGYAPSGPLGIKGVKLPQEMQKFLDNVANLGNAEYPGVGGDIYYFNDSPSIRTQFVNFFVRLCNQ
jgi:ABC-type glycerol-3-phosphate transport system substrate-binding protein